MNFLCHINRPITDLLINYLNLIKEKSSCSEVLCQKVVSSNFFKIFNNNFFKRIPLVAASERVNQTKRLPVFCSCWKEKHR